MEAAASVAVAARGVSMTMPSSQSQSSRKEWRIVSDHHVQNSGDEDLDRAKLGQGDERLIYEVHQGREPVNGHFFSNTVDGGSDHELHLENVVKQREQLQHLEVNLKAQIIARSEVMGMQERFDSQMKEHIAATVKLQEQLHEREHDLMELQRTLDGKDKELHAIRLDHEAAWAKEDLLREQNKELATFRRERDNFEAERAQHLQKINDLQEHIQEKDSQFLELQEQHRVAQEAIIYKDEQIREAQAWITRVQEMDALQSNTLQADIRERTEQYNQLWIGCQRQFAEMERHYLHRLQQLEIELSEARERSGTYSDGTHATQTSVKETSHFVHGNGSQMEAGGGSSPAGDSRGLQNGDSEVVSAQSQTNNIPAFQMAPQALHGMPPYFPPGQLAALHPFILHPQGLPQNVNSQILQSHVGQFHSVPPNSSLSHWQNQQAFSENLQMPNHEQYPSPNDQSSLKTETNYDYEATVNGQALPSEFLDAAHISQGLQFSSAPSSSIEEQPNLQQISSQFHGSLTLNSSDNDSVHQEKNASFLSNHGGDAQSSTKEQIASTAIASEIIRSVNISEATPTKVASAPMPEGYVPIAPKSSSFVGTANMALFDEETLLACVVRTIPPGPGGKIQISSTLLSRLNKMLAPLHWSDYETKHGKLNTFLGSHPELFVIEGDQIRVRDGAKEIIATMVAHSKVRAAAIAASATSSHSSLLSSVAVTPMAQSRMKKAPPVNSNYSSGGKNRVNESPHLAMLSRQHPNGVAFNAVGMRVLGKHNDQMKLNGPEIRAGQASGILVNGNGMNSRSNVVNHGRIAPSFHGKQPGRSTGALLDSRK